MYGMRPHVLASPARRAQQTAQALVELAPRKLKIVDALAPGASAEDVLRAVRMFSMLHVPLVGLVENMSSFLCPDNGKEYLIFGPSNSPAHCKTHGLEFLGALPIELQVSPSADAGLPIVVAEPKSRLAGLYRDLAVRLAGMLDALVAKETAQAGLGQDFFTKPAAAPAQVVHEYKP